MIQLLAGACGILAVLLICAVVYALTYRAERDEARRDEKTQIGANEILSNRITVLRGDIEAQQHTIDTLRAGHDQLVAEKAELERKIGRMEAEARAAKPKRDPKTGRWAKKAKAATVTPIRCG